MKKTTLILLFLSITVGFSQQNFGNQVGKKEVKKDLITFKKFTNTDGAISYGFRMDGLIVGPNMVLHTDGKTTFTNYNKDHQKDGTLIEMNKEEGSIELYTYRNDKKEGPAFKMAGGKIAWQKQFNNDKEDIKGYKADVVDFGYGQNSNGYNGFNMEKYDNDSYAIGYFLFSKRSFPIIHVWKDGAQYMGQCIQGLRKEFGVYFYADGSKYIGSWHKNNKEGLGFKIDKNGTITEKGYYEDNVLKTAL
ncbi:MORN repeat-containing protein [Cellulophaga tyrosinoxydans]|uniref:MORN repeat-containing protein n=1 Tax=Cellulophaga tyrosinoxydans TaxID=504486 RepID=A0A1W2CCN2_9FLAO|nr:hypothetical protein [Cellulophaga tyrosinoxydans]SMC82891.1 MORN repeat-containing protein [Cellulophaga tyrosinoxydans]